MLHLPFNLPFWPVVIGAGSLHFVIGAVAAFAAQRKGHDFRFWLPVGLIAGTPALIAALRLEARSTNALPEND